MQMVRRWKFSTEDEWIFWTDAVGVGIFAATGAHTAVRFDASVYGSAICGMITVHHYATAPWYLLLIAS